MSSKERKRINIDLPGLDTPEFHMINFIANWNGYPLKKYIEMLIDKHLLEETRNKQHLNHVYNEIKDHFNRGKHKQTNKVK